MALHTNRGNGYLAAVLGGVIGAVVLMNLGIYLGIAYVKNFMPNAELEGLLPPFIGSFVGWWIGEVTGCWLALRWRHYRKAGKTAKVLAIVTPLGIIAWFVVYSTLLNWVASRVSELQFAQLYEIARSLSTAIFAIPLAWLARFLTKPHQQK
ncbi:MAG: hypothetical protein KME55_40015 [Nostoc indistinguendum CM1-VF10]|jgi:uncharacterized membrane protein YeaQ/YmgE (transglycosylase-associated protein family)|nr:hypothetical protein [Nostoc indistinguendum CM1-VF10]